MASLNLKSQNKDNFNTPYLETITLVDTLIIPDRIYLSILLTEKDTKGKTSVEDLELRMIENLETMGIDINDQLFLSDIASNFKKYFIKSTDVWKSKEFSLLVYDAFTAGEVIKTLESVNISNIELSKVEYSKIEQIKLELTRKAVERAISQASMMLAPLNQTVGKALFISDISQHPNINHFKDLSLHDIMIKRQYRLKQSSDESSYFNIEFEKIKIESMVKVVFAID